MRAYEFRFINTSLQTSLIRQGVYPNDDEAIGTLRQMTEFPFWSVEVWRELECIYKGPKPVACRITSVDGREAA